VPLVMVLPLQAMTDCGTVHSVSILKLMVGSATGDRNPKYDYAALIK
jgi:hypothetical protein